MIRCSIKNSTHIWQKEFSKCGSNTKKLSLVRGKRERRVNALKQFSTLYDQVRWLPRTLAPHKQIVEQLSSAGFHISYPVLSRFVENPLPKAFSGQTLFKHNEHLILLDNGDRRLILALLIFGLISFNYKHIYEMQTLTTIPWLSNQGVEILPPRISHFSLRRGATPCVSSP